MYQRKWIRAIYLYTENMKRASSIERREITPYKSKKVYFKL